MFSRRRARKQQERQQSLAERIRSATPEERLAAAHEIIREKDWTWAVGELARAMDREPTPETFGDLAGAFCDALCRERPARERVERMFAEHDGDAAALVRAWTAFFAECGSGTALDAVDDDLADDVRRRMRRLTRRGMAPAELATTSAQSTQHMITFGAAVAVLHDAVRRHAPLPAERTVRLREEARAALERAFAAPAGGDERKDLLHELAAPDDDETWTDRVAVGLLVDEALARCADADPRRVTLGVETLRAVLDDNDTPRRAVVREALDEVCARTPDPYTLSEALECYAALHYDEPLAEPPVELFLSALRHPDAVLRQAAAAGLAAVGGGEPEQERVVAALTEVLAGDADTDTRRAAATGLAYFDSSDEAGLRAAFEALDRHADDPDAWVRAMSIEGAVRTGDAAAAFARLDRELRRDDVEPVFLWVAATCADYGDDPFTDTQRATLSGYVNRLDRDGWAARTVADDDWPKPENRRTVLDEALKALKEPQAKAR